MTILFRTQVTCGSFANAYTGPRVFTVFVQATHEYRARARAVQLVSDAWQRRLDDIMLLGRVVDEAQLRSESQPLTEWMTDDHVLLELLHEAGDVDPDGRVYARHDDTLLFVEPAWHARLQDAMFWLGVHLFDTDFAVQAMTAGAPASSIAAPGAQA